MSAAFLISSLSAVLSSVPSEEAFQAALLEVTPGCYGWAYGCPVFACLPEEGYFATRRWTIEGETFELVISAERAHYFATKRALAAALEAA